MQACLLSGVVLVVHARPQGMDIRQRVFDKELYYRALFRWPQSFKFFHSFFITLIFGRMHRALNIGKKNN